MEMRLLVLKTGDMKGLADFYSLLGMNFKYHKHGKSPYHYSATFRNMVVEIYPLPAGQVEADKSLRIGFGLNNFSATIDKLKDADALFSQEPVGGEFGLMAVVVDPDGRKIELYKDEHSNPAHNKELQEKLTSFAMHCEKQVGKKICIKNSMSLSKTNFDRHFAMTSKFDFELTHFAVRTSGLKLMFMGEKFDYEMDLMSICAFSGSENHFSLLEKFSSTIFRRTEITFE